MTSDRDDPTTTSQSREPASLIAVRQLAAERRQLRNGDDRLHSAARIRAARRRHPVGRDETGR
ncbi:hypothetical protein ACI8AG_01140 [Blastococcus sp. SYSU DS0552]